MKVCVYVHSHTHNDAHGALTRFLFTEHPVNKNMCSKKNIVYYVCNNVGGYAHTCVLASVRDLRFSR